MPSIKDVVTAQRTVPATTVNETKIAQETTSANNLTEGQDSTATVPNEQNTLLSEAAMPTPSETAPATTPQVQSGQETFEQCWKTLFDELFSNNHLIYYNLKDEVPRYENDTIYIVVKNGIQKDQFETNKQAIVEYWRNHFSLNIDDIEISVDEHKEEKKVIISAEDKFRNMTEQNANLPEFLNILGFRMKD